jgi:hypothetical protein
MDHRDDETDQVFIMRLWKEPQLARSADFVQWRAQISHLNTGNKFHVDGVERALAAVRSILLGLNGHDGRSER